MLKVSILLAILLVVGAIACSKTDERSEGAVDAISIETSQQVFVTNCAVCHGTAGQGDPDWRIRTEDGTLRPPPLNGDGHTWHHSDGVLYRTVRDGGGIPSQPDYKSGMPAFGDTLTRQEILDVLAYIKSLWEEKPFADASLTELQAARSVNDPFPG